MAKVVDFTGAELAKPFEFSLDRSGVRSLVERVRRSAPVSVSLVRVGLEAAGHYHLPLAGGVLPEDWELRVLNPGHVSMQRKVN
ncbi:MAG: transposase, partial [Actinomycetota bacterium]